MMQMEENGLFGLDPTMGLSAGDGLSCGVCTHYKHWGVYFVLVRRRSLAPAALIALHKHILTLTYAAGKTKGLARRLKIE